MLNTGITATISLRTRGSVQFSSNNYSHYSNGSRPFAYSSSTPCCSCCCNSMYNTVPLSPSYGCSLYGLRQSSLIQWSPCRRLISGSFDYYSRFPVCDVDGICYCDRVCNVREKKVGRRKGGLKKCLVYEERSGRYEQGSVDEAEVLLSLLTEEVDEECFLVRKETRRLVRKPVVEKRENGEVCDECGSKKKKVDVVVSGSDSRSEHGLVVSSRRNDNRRRKEINRREEEEEALLREENRKTRLKEEHRGALLKNQTEREKEERDALLRKARLREEHRGALLKNRMERELEEKEALLRKASQKAKEKQERDLILRKENWNVRSSTEEEDRLKVRRDGSSCSSYYSLSSNGDYESDHDIDFKEGVVQEDSSSGHKRNSRSDEIVYHDTKEEDQRREDYREDHGFSLTKKTSSKEFHTGPSIVESDFRKKSEKRLTDTSMDEMESRKETSVKESKSSMARKSNFKKSSDYSVSYDDRKVKSTRSMEHDEERIQQLGQTSDEVSKQSETMLKYKQSVERQDFRSGDVRKFSGSQKVYSGKDDMSAKVASSNRETVGEHQAVIGLGTREDDYRKNIRKVDKTSEVQEIDIRKTSISQQRFETNVRVEGYSINTSSSTNDAKKRHQQYDQVSGLLESTGNTQQLTRRDAKSGSKKETGKFSKQEGNANLVSSSYLESKEPGSLIPSKITKSVNSRNESDELNKVLIIHSGNSGALMVDDRNKTKTGTPVRPPPNLPETGVLSPGPKVGDTDEDAIGSASRLEKSSAHYVGEFVKKVRNDILSSEIQTEKEIYETTHGDSSHSKEHELGSNNQQIGTRGPSDEMWNVDEPSVQESSKPEVEDKSSKAENVFFKRTGRSLWNIIQDIVLLRWSPHSGSHSSGRKTGGRSSPNQSTSSGTWFSGPEAEENEEATEQKEGRIIRQGLSSSHQEAKTRSQVEESPSSSALEAHLRHAGAGAPSSSVIRESGSPLTMPSLPSGREISEEHTSYGTVVDPSNPLSALRLRKSPSVQGDLQEGEAHASDNGMSEQLNSGSTEQTRLTVNDGELKQKKLQRKDQIVRERFDEWAEAYRLESEQQKIDEMFMREALLEAQKAADNWEVPVGAVLVHNRKIIARGCNLVEELRDSTAHAEILCIREASKMLRTWRLSETTLYVTLEPCPMCAGAILQARIDTVVWGAPNKLLGADGSWIRLFPGDGGNGTEQTDMMPAPVHPFHPKITIRRGVMASECADAMQQFFKRRRKKDKNAEAPTTPPSCLPISNRPSKFLAKMHDAFHLMLCL